MRKENLSEKITDLKLRFAEFYQHRKKAKSLENYSINPKFSHKNYLQLIKGCLGDGFLEEVESKFLDHMLKKYQLNYLDWAHRTKWLKRKMQEVDSPKSKKAAPIQTFFPFMKSDPPVHVPITIVAGATKTPEARL